MRYILPDADFGTIRLSTPPPGHGVSSPGADSHIPAETPADARLRRKAQVAWRQSTGQVIRLSDNSELWIGKTGEPVRGRPGYYKRCEFMVNGEMQYRAEVVCIGRTMSWYDYKYYLREKVGNPDLVIAMVVDSFNVWPRRERGRRLPVLHAPDIQPETDASRAQTLMDKILKLDTRIIELQVQAENAPPTGTMAVRIDLQVQIKKLFRKKEKLEAQL